MTERSLIVLSLPAPASQEVEAVRRLALPEAGATILPPGSAKLLVESGRRYERYVVTLSQSLRSLVGDVVRRVDQPEALDAYAREKERSRALAPLLVRTGAQGMASQ